MPQPRYALRALLLFAALYVHPPVLAAEHPHILYITVDDLGWKDVGYHGSTVQTPTIDRLATAGARLEQFYVQPFASQTRAAVLTGRYPMRYGFQTMQVQWNSQFGIPADERLLPKALQEAGYRSELIGTWRLGRARKEMRPTHRGFDHFYGHLSGEIDYFKKTDRGGEPDWWQDDKPLREHGYATSLLARHAVQTIARHEPQVPLFLWLAFAAPQAPHQAPPQFLERYEDIHDPDRRAYRAMISAVDDAIAEVLTALEKRGMLADTLILFHSTTGGALPTKYPIGEGDTRSEAASNGPYRNGKGSLYEGGLRGVAFAVWPEHIQAAVVGELIHVVDLYPTLLGLVGVKV